GGGGYQPPSDRRGRDLAGRDRVDDARRSADGDRAGSPGGTDGADAQRAARGCGAGVRGGRGDPIRDGPRAAGPALTNGSSIGPVSPSSPINDGASREISVIRPTGRTSRRASGPHDAPGRSPAHAAARRALARAG